jgi:hypothetical protein
MSHKCSSRLDIVGNSCVYCTFISRVVPRHISSGYTSTPPVAGEEGRIISRGMDLASHHRSSALQRGMPGYRLQC